MHGEKVFIMATSLSTCHPADGIQALNRLPGLAEPLLQIDLERELQQQTASRWHYRFCSFIGQAVGFVERETQSAA
jgi:hypothetical protein